MSEKLPLFYFSSSSHLNYLLLPCNPFQLDSMETKRFRNYSSLAMLALTCLFCGIKAKRDESFTSDESLAAEPSANVGAV